METWVCRAESLRDLHDECRALGEELSARAMEWSVRQVNREYNKVADALANEALDLPAENGRSLLW